MRLSSLAALSLATAALAACGKSAGSAGLGLSQPSSVAVFRGFTVKNAGLHDYVAIANTGRNELILVDAVDDAPILSPILIRPLAVSVGEPRPAEVLAGSLHDSTELDPRADLLVVRSAGSTVLQVVRTWIVAGQPADTRVVPALDVDLAAAAPGAAVLSMVAAPVPVSNGVGGFVPAPGRVRVVAALSGQRLAVAEFTRQPDGSIAGGPAVLQDLALLVGTETIRFEAASLGLNPLDPLHLYAASRDPIPTATGTVLGAAELDMTGAVGAWTWKALDARAPTTLVAAYTLRERKPTSAADGADAFVDTPSPRVYAMLDTLRCGASERIGCGIAVLDPATGKLLPDPSGGMPYMAPIAVPSVPLAMVVSPPPANPPSQAPEDVGFAAPFMRIAPGGGIRATTAVLELPSTDGQVYFVDLGRWSIPNNYSLLRLSSSRTAVTDAASLTAGEQRIGVWDIAPTTKTPPAAPVLVVAASILPGTISVTPGFTPGDSWSAVWQGLLPGLGLRVGETGDVGDGRPWLALQVRARDAAGVERPTQVVRLYDPALGVHVGDSVVVATRGLSGCPDLIEARIAELRAPDAQRPGGYVVLEERACTPASTATGAPDCTLRDGFRACRPALAAGHQGRAATFYAGDLLVSAAGIGYAGRAPIASEAEVTANPQAPELQYRLDYLSPDGLNEDALAALCPLIPWPWPDPFPATPATVTCDATCRARCEQLVLVRKARRIYHVSDKCGDIVTDASCNQVWAGLPFPAANGPVLVFRLGLKQGATTPDAPISRGLGVVFGTRSGLSPASRAPVVAAGATPTLPLGAAVYDRSAIPGKAGDGYRVYVPYADGAVLDFSPSLGSNTPVVIR